MNCYQFSAKGKDKNTYNFTVRYEAVSQHFHFTSERDHDPDMKFSGSVSLLNFLKTHLEDTTGIEFPTDIYTRLDVDCFADPHHPRHREVVEQDANLAMAKTFELLQRETDDATAKPVFIVFRVPYSGGDHPPHKKWSDKYIADMYDDGFDVEKVKEAQDAGDRAPDLRSDYNPMDVVGVFWTREEAQAWMANNKHNGPHFSWGAPAKGVLTQVMDYTCKREIERRLVRERKVQNGN